MSTTSSHKDTLKDYYVRLTNMFENALGMLTGLNTALSTRASEVTVTTTDASGNTSNTRIPSFIYLESKLEQLEANFNALFEMPGSGEAWFNDSENMFKLQFVKSNNAPLAPEYTSEDLYASLKDNTVLKDLVSPRTYLKLNISNLPQNVSQMFMKKIVVYDADTYSALKALDISSYEDYSAALYNYTSGIDYEEYDSIINMPVRRDRYTSAFSIIDVPDDLDYDNPYTTTNDSGDTVRIYEVELDTLNYYDVDDTAITFTLKPGDKVCLGNSNTVYIIKNVNTSNNVVILEEYVGHVHLTDVSSDSSMVLSIYNESYAEYNYVEVPLEENRYVIVFIGSVYNNVRSALGPGMLLDLSDVYMKDASGNDIVDGNGNGIDYISYYKEYCTNIGDLILGLTQASYPQLSNYTAQQLYDAQHSVSLGTLLNSAIDVESNLSVVPINKHLTDDDATETLKNLHAQKSDLNAQLDTLQSNIDDVYNTLITTDFSQTVSVTQASLQSQLNTYYTQRTQVEKQLNAVIDSISGTISSVNPADIKYRVRGIIDVDDIEEYIHGVSDSNLDIIGLDVEYRYKSTDSDTSTLTVINSSTFTEWNKYTPGTDRERSMCFDTINNSDATNIKSWDIVYDDYTSTDNIIKWNQIDIPIRYGEDVVIRYRCKLNVGQPYINIYTDWSDEVTVTFPEEYVEDVEVKTIIDTNADDAVVAGYRSILINEGYEEHVQNKSVSSESTFYHQPENIYSGFLTAENTMISLKDKLNNIVSDIESCKEALLGLSNSSYEVYVDIEGTDTKISPNTINKINVYNTDHISNTFIKKEFNIIIKNTGTSRLNLYSIFPGPTGTALLCSDVDSYTDRLGVYERVPLIVNGELYAQSLGQWVYFRSSNPFTGSSVYYTNSSQESADTTSLSDTEKYAVGEYIIEPSEYLNVDNAQVLLGYRERGTSTDYYYNILKNIVSAIKDATDTTTLTTLASKISDVSKLNDDIYDNVESEDAFKYTNTRYYSSSNEDNYFLCRYEDVCGKNNKSKSIVYLDSKTPISTFMSTYNPDRFEDTDDLCGGFLYPNLLSRSTILTSGSENDCIYINEGESVSIPVCFEYYLDGSEGNTSITKSLYFDLRNSLVADPVHYMIEVTGYYDYSSSGDIYTNFDTIVLSDGVTNSEN